MRLDKENLCGKSFYLLLLYYYYLRHGWVDRYPKILNKKCRNLDKALLVGVILPNNYQPDIENYLSELSLLAKTAEVEVLGRITQICKPCITPPFFLNLSVTNSE